MEANFIHKTTDVQHSSWEQLLTQASEIRFIIQLNIQD